MPNRGSTVRDLRWSNRIAADGDVRGFYVRSLLDNFEWVNCYSRRFRLPYTDYGTQTRIPQTSARWYRQLIAKHR
jgi:beta-glucosidase